LTMSRTLSRGMTILTVPVPTTSRSPVSPVSDQGEGTHAGRRQHRKNRRSSSQNGSESTRNSYEEVSTVLGEPRQAHRLDVLGGARLAAGQQGAGEHDRVVADVYDPGFGRDRPGGESKRECCEGSGADRIMRLPVMAGKDELATVGRNSAGSFQLISSHRFSGLALNGGRHGREGMRVGQDLKPLATVAEIALVQMVTGG